MRREERVTVQGPVKEQQPDGMSHRGLGVDSESTPEGDVVTRGAHAVQSGCTAGSTGTPVSSHAVPRA